MENAASAIGPYDEDEFLIRATARDRWPRMRIYRPQKTAVVLGRGSNPATELHFNECCADRVPILRRRGGGCAVVTDPGNIIVSVVLPANGLNHTRQHFDNLTLWLLDGLRKLGVADAYRDGMSDLVREDRKIAGACIYRTKGLLYYSATLLADPQLDKIERYLKHPPREPAYRRWRRHHEFIGRLAIDGRTVDVEQVIAGLEDVLRLEDLARGPVESAHCA